MSFVLDAQRRQAEAASPEDAARKAYEQAKKRGKHRRLITASVFLACAMLAFIWWLIADFERKKEHPSSMQEIAAPAIQPELRLQAPAPRPTVQPEPTLTPAPARKAALPLSQAPAIVQDTLLGFDYSSHIYSSEPGSRLIFVNGEKLKIGDRHAGWVLDAINEDGVVWSRGGERFTVPLLQIWEQ